MVRENRDVKLGNLKSCGIFFPESYFLKTFKVTRRCRLVPGMTDRDREPPKGTRTIKGGRSRGKTGTEGGKIGEKTIHHVTKNPSVPWSMHLLIKSQLVDVPL